MKLHKNLSVEPGCGDGDRIDDLSANSLTGGSRLKNFRVAISSLSSPEEATMHPSTTAQQFEEALRNCEFEPIHLPGKIQEHGVLLGIDPLTFEVTIASENSDEYLALSPAEIIGRSLASILGFSVQERVSRIQSNHDLSRPFPFLISVCRGSTAWDAEASLHRRGSRLILELECSDLGGVGAALHLADWIHQFPRTTSETESIQPFCQSIAHEVRNLSGYDRTMIYQFHSDLHGEVIAESVRSGLSPFLGLHYPASDIPKQARALYLQSRVRVLADVHAPVVSLVGKPNDLATEPLDMTLCNLRGFSPVHLQYLSNMGVGASLVTSIILGDRLWGLLVCHHGRSRNPTHSLRVACNLLSEMISVEVAAFERRQELRVHRSVSDLQRRILDTFMDDSDWKQSILASPEAYFSPIRATGLAIIENSDVLIMGSVPDVGTILRIRDWVTAAHPGSVYSTDALGEAEPSFAGIAQASGVLVAEISRLTPTHLIWFRSEIVQEINWGGEPHKDIVINDRSVQLLPRKSFESWRSSILGRSQPWETIDLASASEIRTSVIEAILRTSLRRGARTEIELVRVQKAIAASSEAILIADEKGHPTFVNQAFVDLCQIDLDDLPRRSVSAPVVDHRIRNEILEATLVRGGSWHGEIEVRRLGEPEITPVDLKIDPVLNEMGMVIGFIAIHFDLTEKNRARKLLEEHARRLEKARIEVEQQALMLKDAKARAESANRAKTDFLANMCHEIRTPMNGVIGLSELLLDSPLNESQVKYVRTIRASGDALMTVINDILDLSKIEAGKMTIVPAELDLRSMLYELSDLLEPKARQKGVKLSVEVAADLPSDLLGDSIRIRQILTNLAGNAIKFTDQGEVKIRGDLVHDGPTEARIKIEVEDTGIGIPESFRTSIFESFTQGEDGNIRASAGTGLGLAICRKLVDLMEGEIDFKSKVGKGSRFWVILTLKHSEGSTTVPENPTAPVAPPQIQQTQALRILVAEDNAVNQLVARGLISRIGHEVTVVSNGQEAVDLVAREKFDLILMDVQMPIMDGFGATAEIRRQEALIGRRTPIVALTAYALREDCQRCLDAGMDDYLSKPISPVALREMLDRFRPPTP